MPPLRSSLLALAAVAAVFGALRRIPPGADAGERQPDPTGAAAGESETPAPAGEIAGLLREIRDRLPSPAAPPRPRLPGGIHLFVKEVEPWGVLLAAVGLFLALIAFWIDYRDRVEERTVRAWQLLTTRAPGNSGKIAALEYLNREDGLLCFGGGCLLMLKARIPLTGIDLSASDNRTPDYQADYPPGVYLLGADLGGAILAGADLSGAILSDADLGRAALPAAKLGGAYMEQVNLSGAFLFGADLSGAALPAADLGGTNLRGANFSGAILFRANLSGALLSGTQFTGWDGPAEGLTQEQLDAAWAWADQPPRGLEELVPPLALPDRRLCDPALRAAWHQAVSERPLNEQLRFGPPAACSAVEGTSVP